MKKGLFILLTSTVLLTGCSSQKTEEDIVTLILACWVEDFELQVLVETFNENHDNAQIEVVEYYNDTIAIDAAIQRMYSSLISGDLADLYYLDSMDVMSMRNANLLADLYPIMDADGEFQRSDYYENIWDSFSSDGKLYELAPGFQLGCLIGPQSVIGDRLGWTIQEYEAFAGSLRDTQGGIRVSRSNFLTYMIQFSMQDYINVEAGTCSFSTDSFVNWLTFIGSFPAVVDETLEYTLYSGWIMGLSEYLQFRNQFGDTPMLVGYPNDAASGVCAMSLGSYGISSTTEYQDLCWEFLKLTLSEEYQTQYISNTSFPVKKSVFQSQLVSAMLPASDQASLLYGFTTSTGQPEDALTQEEATYLLNLLETVTQARFRYDAVREIITEEATSYFGGDKTAEAVAELIQSRVTLYLDEKQ